jgi:hypothetical protein
MHRFTRDDWVLLSMTVSQMINHRQNSSDANLFQPLSFHDTTFLLPKTLHENVPCRLLNVLTATRFDSIP